MIYNTDFDVKYFRIQNELIQKCNSSSNFYEYSKEDVVDICNKLYHDELSSVFFAENILDDKIDRGIRNILEKMKENHHFKNMLDELIFSIFPPQDILSYDKEIFNKNYNDSDFIIYLGLFSYDIFHLTHKIICQVLSNQEISPDLLQNIKELTKNILMPLNEQIK